MDGASLATVNLINLKGIIRYHESLLMHHDALIPNVDLLLLLFDDIVSSVSSFVLYLSEKDSNIL